MGTNKKSCKTAAVMNLLSRGTAGEKRPMAEILSQTGGTENVSNLDTAREQIEYIGIDRLDDDPNNFYELSNLDDLAANIELLGLQQPIRVRPGDEPGRYVIISGHRRRAAVRRLVEEGRDDLLFKAAKDRGSGQYEGLSLDTEMTVSETKTMYRVITGACQQGTEMFVESFGDKLKEKYTIREMLTLTKGQYGAVQFAAFFEK